MSICLHDLFGLVSERSLYRPQYYEIYRLRRVVGVSYVFMSIDALGGVFSVLSLAFREKWDVTASISYTLIIVRTLLWSHVPD